MMRLGTDADVYGASLFSDGATVKHAPLLNFWVPLPCAHRWCSRSSTVATI